MLVLLLVPSLEEISKIMLYQLLAITHHGIPLPPIWRTNKTRRQSAYLDLLTFALLLMNRSKLLIIDSS